MNREIIQVMKSETIEGAEAWGRFNEIVDKVLTVPRSVIERRESEYQRQSKLNPNRRGPKSKPSSPAPAV